MPRQRPEPIDDQQIKGHHDPKNLTNGFTPEEAPLAAVDERNEDSSKEIADAIEQPKSKLE